MGCGASSKYKLPEYHIAMDEVSGWLECIVTHSQTLLPDARNRRALAERLEEPVAGLTTPYATAGKRTELEVLVHGLPRWATVLAECAATTAPKFEVRIREDDAEVVDALVARFHTETRAPPRAAKHEGAPGARAPPVVHFCVALGDYAVQKPYYDGSYPEVMRLVDGDGAIAVTVFAYGEEVGDQRVFHAFAGDVRDIHDASACTKRCVAILEEASGKLALRGRLAEPPVRLALAALLLRRLRLQWTVVLAADLVS